MNHDFLRGRHAIVTGGNRGIGAAIAWSLARAGASLTLMGRDAIRLVETGNEIAAECHIDVMTIECDVTDEAAVIDAFHRAGDAYILVNNAGQALGAELHHTSRELWDQMIAVNLTGTFHCTQRALPAMIRNGEGRIINIASTAGLKGYSRITAYCAAKHGVVGFTRALAMETARTGVTVNAVCPAYAETEMGERAIQQVATHRRISADEARQKLERLIPIGRLIRPEEIAAAVLWLCSPDSGAVTGEAVAVAGGEVP
ncbi:MAG TPA: SDR family NAD(P)-dependent oxidoreductase [Longimicrobiales bacterium]|nr:SDR family NAD(P)-dependent oxidoreductase [Longimicrobiales bacterium]